MDPVGVANDNLDVSFEIPTVALASYLVADIWVAVARTEEEVVNELPEVLSHTAIELTTEEEGPDIRFAVFKVVAVPASSWNTRFVPLTYSIPPDARVPTGTTPTSSMYTTFSPPPNADVPVRLTLPLSPSKNPTFAPALTANWLRDGYTPVSVSPVNVRGGRVTDPEGRRS
jgi:hypothetical protein